jgi:hypothetical protein
MTTEEPTSIALASSAEAVILQLDHEARAALVADLQTLAEGGEPSVAMQAGNETYMAAVMSSGWTAVYRELKPGEPWAHPGRRAIVVIDLLGPEQFAAPYA